uniref:Lectin-domain containing receptor kinase A4.2 n=1 Tax=Cajanus cajan TaxID=3821 RepID=A0A151RT92_CAJCA|nr:Lectin-domain containing receptor kinase A4.2 [Cajanus cajan]
MQHVGIDDNSLTSVAFAKFDIDNNLGKTCHALVTYTASSQTLFVSWSFKGKPITTNTNANNNESSLSYQIDLKKILPEWVNIGFSASTGLSTERNVIHSWEFMEWQVRYKVALGVATALRYLHEDAEQCVLHRDIKSANVLLDNEFNTKVGDFGMAKLVDPRLRSQRTGVVGTYGYLAPEYVGGGRASRESDVYSFGVVALEIASGRRTYQEGEFHVSLMNWVWELYVEGEIVRAADEKLKGEFEVSEMESLLVVGLWCTNPNDKERPKAAQVIKVLQLEAPLPLLPLDMYQRAPPPPQIIRLPHHHHSLQSPPITTSLTSVGR